MALTTVAALLTDPPDPPKPPKPPTPASSSTAFQRNLQAQRAAARNEPEPLRSGAATSQRPTRQIQQRPAGRQGAAGEGLSGNPVRPSTDAESPGAAGGSACGVDYGGRGGGGAGTGGDQSGTAGSTGGVGEAADGDLDGDLLLELLPTDGDSGIFELLMPGGDTLAVVADVTQRQASFLLTPSSERLRSMINKRKMELENGLTQRMQRHVRLTVL